MSVPDFQSLMLPLMKIVGDGIEHTTSEIIETLAQQIGLGEEDRDEMLPSGKQRKFDNRVNWTKTYLQKALLISSTGRSRFRITERGITVLKKDPLSINVKFLNQFPEFLAFHTAIQVIAVFNMTLTKQKAGGQGHAQVLSIASPAGPLEECR